MATYSLERDPPCQLGSESTVKKDARKARRFLKKHGISSETTRVMVQTDTGNMCITTDRKLIGPELDYLCYHMGSGPNLNRLPVNAPSKIKPIHFYYPTRP